jgi:hypothetical protein
MLLDMEVLAMRDSVKMGIRVSHDGDTWRILSTGVVREDGKTFCHLASESRGLQQKNGWVPVQINDWINLADAEDDRDPIASYYEDRANSGLSSLEAHR